MLFNIHFKGLQREICALFTVGYILSTQAVCAADSAADKAWSAQINAGKLSVGQMQSSKAEQAYLAAVNSGAALDPYHKAIAVWTLAHFYLDQNRYKDAEKSFLEVLELSKQCDTADTETVNMLGYSGCEALYKATKEQAKYEEAKKAGQAAKAEILNGIPKWQTYLQNTGTIVRKGWKEHKSRLTVSNPHPVSVYCRINKSGLIDCVTIWKSSGAAELDQDAIEALRAISPLPAMDSTARNNLTATYLFESEPLNHNQVEMSEKALLQDLEKSAVKGDMQRVNALLTLAMLARSKNNRPVAEGYLNKALQLAQEEPADPSLLMQVNLSLADYKRQYNEFQQATDYAEKALNYSKNTNNSEFYSTCLELKANMLMKSGKTEESLKCFAELAELKKSDKEKAGK